MSTGRGRISTNILRVLTQMNFSKRMITRSINERMPVNKIEFLCVHAISHTRNIQEDWWSGWLISFIDHLRSWCSWITLLLTIDLVDAESDITIGNWILDTEFRNASMNEDLCHAAQHKTYEFGFAFFESMYDYHIFSTTHLIIPPGQISADGNYILSILRQPSFLALTSSEEHSLRITETKWTGRKDEHFNIKRKTSLLVKWKCIGWTSKLERGWRQIYRNSRPNQREKWVKNGIGF